VREFFLTFVIEQYQLILICALLLFLTIKIIRNWQEKTITNQMNQLLAPIEQDVLLEKHAPAIKFEAQNVSAIKKTLQGIDLNALSKKTVNLKVQPKQTIQPEFASDEINNSSNIKIITPTHQKTPSSQSTNEIALNLKRFDTEFEHLLSSMEMRAQMRKKQ